MTNQVRNTEAGDQRETMLEMMILEVRVNDDSKVQDKVGWKTEHQMKVTNGPSFQALKSPDILISTQFLQILHVIFKRGRLLAYRGSLLKAKVMDCTYYQNLQKVVPSFIEVYENGAPWNCYYTTCVAVAQPCGHTEPDQWSSPVVLKWGIIWG